MELYRKENIELLMGAIETDEYEDIVQKDNLETVNPHYEFFSRNKKDASVSLELGCGSGDSFEYLYPVNALEPSSSRYALAVKEGEVHGVEVVRGVTECLPYKDQSFDHVYFIDGFFQVRCPYESLIEINRVLCVNGRFAFNFISGDNQDIVVGFVWSPNNILRVLSDFGFEQVIENRTMELEYSRFPKPVQYTYLCVEKTRNFNPKYLNKLFIDTSKSKLSNFIFDRDYRLV